MESISLHEKYMRRCLELALKGLGKTGLNPLVGSVIVHKGRIIGEGYHREFGGPHAEVNAINSVRDKGLLKDSTIYVNLEPCSHYGKTPPCSLLIRQMGIPRVVIGMTDPNPEVSGRGIESLQEAGIRVTTDILGPEASFLNRRFMVNQKKKRPYIILKWAQSQDGFIDMIRSGDNPVQPNWITNHTARMLVHKWRSEEGAITAGTNTILTDNPSLNLRDWTGTNPVRVIIDRKNRIPEHFNVRDDSIHTFFFTNKKIVSGNKNTRFFQLPENYNLKEFLEKLYSLGIGSLLVEGGTEFINSFIINDLWEEARIFTGNIRFQKGIISPKFDEKINFFMIFRNHKLSIRVKGIT